MRSTLVVCVSHRGVSAETQRCLHVLEQAGARVQTTTGVADVAMARNQALTRALSVADRADAFLLVDDDMVWDLEAAQRLVSAVRAGGPPRSGAYATSDGHLAATPLNWEARADGLRMTGLGFFAVRRAQLLELSRRLSAVIGPHGQRFFPFCQCGIADGLHDGLPRWCSEDYWLCRALGGARIEPRVAAGHLKRVPLWPDGETLDRIAEGKSLRREENEHDSASPAS